MSVIIKGMDMPKKDTGCRIIILYDGQVAMDDGTFIPKYKAVEIPTPHGRLIDRDAVPEVSADPYEEGAFQGTLDDMPVFLEAEE